MPRVILPDDPHAVSREISQADYDHAVEQQGVAQRLHEDPSAPERIWLWDLVDGSRSGPFARESVYHHYLRKVVYKCSACSFTTVFDSATKSHGNAIIRKALDHQGDVITDGVHFGRPVKVCVGCRGGATFQSLPEARQHVEGVLTDAAVHEKGVQWITMRRFSLERPVEPIGETVIVPINGNGVAPQERSKRRRHRSRRRGTRSSV